MDAGSDYRRVRVTQYSGLLRQIGDHLFGKKRYMRGNLDLNRDTSRHRVYSARYEDLLK
jgi:hypothetical protein